VPATNLSHEFHRFSSADPLKKGLLRLHVERVVPAVNIATPGSYTEVEIPER
jgi:hypothetical protein